MKRNLRKIPDDVLAKIKTIKGKNVVVGCAVKFKADVTVGYYRSPLRGYEMARN